MHLWSRAGTARVAPRHRFGQARRYKHGIWLLSQQCGLAWASFQLSGLENWSTWCNLHNTTGRVTTLQRLHDRPNLSNYSQGSFGNRLKVVCQRVRSTGCRATRLRAASVGSAERRQGHLSGRSRSAVFHNNNEMWFTLVAAEMRLCVLWNSAGHASLCASLQPCAGPARPACVPVAPTPGSLTGPVTTAQGPRTSRSEEDRHMQPA